MLVTAIWVLRAANWLNWIVAALLMFLLALLVIAPGPFREAFASAFPESRPAAAVLLWLKLA